MITREQFLGVVRHGLTFVGGILVMYGVIDDAMFTEISGGLITLAGAFWSIYAKKTPSLPEGENEPIQ